MTGRKAPLLLRLLKPESLRYQLLSRSLFVLAGLLLLIGTLQYVLMKDFIYNNRAEALEAQIQAMPRQWHSDYKPGYPKKSPYNGDETPNAATSSQPPEPSVENPSTQQNGQPPSSDPARSPDPNGQPSQENPSNMPNFTQPGLSLAYVSNTGERTVMTTSSETWTPELSQAEYMKILKDLKKHREVSYQLLSNSEGAQQLVVFRLAGPPDSPDGLIQAGNDTDLLQTVLASQLAIFAGLSILALAGGLSLYLPLLRKTLAPLSRIVKAVQRTDAINLTERLPISQGQQEIDLLSEAFNGMLGRLESSFETERQTTERMRRFVADASHELRTPLTSIHGFLEVLLRGAASNPEQLHRALTSMKLESTRINKLVEDLLLLAKLDQAPELVKVDTSLDKLIHELEPQLHILGGQRKVLIETANEISGRYNPDQLKQVVLNLFLNAVQHTDAQQGKITLKLAKAGAKAVISVTDNGAGIKPEHLPHLFERFYRSEFSRTRLSGGAGLGLSITQSIVEAHGGTIEAASIIGEGSTFTVKLPLEDV
ncbi:two-component system, OmpR family, sensor kinase [Paenibacillus algorifonticola]|uniref:histidine kinase n=1 Tax=Paenibacillus algorifonticola TaxID=684063 RepID=A0A1I2A2D9_9BACL|nr:ATP-binding protein [Paenibacillus algorifonticola]SFE38284.1 two-component system, OmpR family, sensor kinase [Paenibacillus algorifonticola]